MCFIPYFLIMTKIKNNTVIICVAILALVGLEIAAMYYGINGKMFALICTIIAGLAGLALPQIKVLKN